MATKIWKACTWLGLRLSLTGWFITGHTGCGVFKLRVLIMELCQYFLPSRSTLLGIHAPNADELDTLWPLGFTEAVLSLRSARHSLDEICPYLVCSGNHILCLLLLIICRDVVTLLKCNSPPIWCDDKHLPGVIKARANAALPANLSLYHLQIYCYQFSVLVSRLM